MRVFTPAALYWSLVETLPTRRYNPALRRLRLLHAWIIERETQEEPTDTFIDFPREEGK
jgi:hypothetical protein